MLNVVIVGTGRRCLGVYVPVVRRLPSLRLTGICGRHYERTERIARQLDVTPYNSLDAVLSDTSVGLLIVCVDWTVNETVYRHLGRISLPALIETPLATSFASATEVAQLLSSRMAPTEVAEQYHLRPLEIIKRQLIAEGLFGEIFFAYSDGIGHDYHGISLIRSYLGFDQRLRRVAAMQRDVPCFPHVTHKGIFFPGERICHALLEFESGAQAIYNWSWLAYESPIRCRRTSGFHGTKGAAWGAEWVVFTDFDGPASAIRLERRTRVVDGVEVLHEYVAFLGGQTAARWQNPFSYVDFDEERIVAALLLEHLAGEVAGEEGPLYPPSQALEDHRIVQAMEDALQPSVGWATPPSANNA